MPGRNSEHMEVENGQVNVDQWDVLKALKELAPEELREEIQEWIDSKVGRIGFVETLEQTSVADAKEWRRLIGQLRKLEAPPAVKINPSTKI